MRHRLTAYLNRSIFAIGVAVNVIALMATLFTAYSGYIDPFDMPFAGLAGLTFPIWLVVDGILIVADIVFCRTLTLLPLVALIGSYGPILTFSPMHLFGHELTADEEARSFTVLNYNVLQLHDYEGVYPDGYNRTLHNIIEVNADVVCIQECNSLGVNQNVCVTQAQLDTLNRIYPHQTIEWWGQVLLSKYPFETIQIQRDENDKGCMIAHTLTVNGRDLTIINVHLQSIGLTADDKELYRDLTDVSSDKHIHQVKSRLISKLYDASRRRAVQADRLYQYINEIGGNIIVCGDFNDTPGCYTLRTMERAGMSDAYAETALGPTITYRANRLYFRIDHAFYKGDMIPVSIVRGNVRSSDHYPLLTTYIWN